MIRLEHVSKTFTTKSGYVHAVKDISLDINEGEIFGIIGFSGAGKSTLVRCMNLLERPEEGSVIVDDKNLLELDGAQLREMRKKIGMIFQDAGASLCPIRTIGEQIYESMCAHTKITRSEAKTRAMDLFDKLNFKDSQRVWDSYPFELSGGMNQRAGIAIAMLMNPPILFADEPTSALDVSVQRQVVREMLKLRELFGTAIVIVTHDIGVVRAMADTVLVLKNGKTIEYGTADRVLDHPQDPYTRKLLEAVPKLQRKVRV